MLVPKPKRETKSEKPPINRKGLGTYMSKSKPPSLEIKRIDRDPVQV